MTSLREDDRLDLSNGYEAAAAEFMAGRESSRVGVRTVRAWAESFSPGASILDLGCGHGVPISQTLADAGLAVWGVDASPGMVAAFRARFPAATVACESVEASALFARRFEGAVSWGMMFLLPAPTQHTLIQKVGAALVEGGRFLFTAPWQECEWTDVLTGRLSVSLGRAEYERSLTAAGLTLAREHVDEGENHYFEAIRRATCGG